MKTSTSAGFHYRCVVRGDEPSGFSSYKIERMSQCLCNVSNKSGNKDGNEGVNYWTTSLSNANLFPIYALFRDPAVNEGNERERRNEARNA